jgi:hypothetical protein
MANLHTTLNYFARGRTTLELKPNSPSQREMVDTYTLRLWVNDQLVYDRIQSVRDWQMRHTYVEDIAKAFCCIRELIGKEISCTMNVATNDEKDLYYHTSVCAYEDTEWLRVALSAAPTRRFGELVQVNLYLQQAETQIGDFEYRNTSHWGRWAEMIWAIILCTPDDAIDFGRQLLEEIQSVEQERIALGIPEYDDTSYSDEVV